MEVILRDHVDNLGRRGEIVKVADGYARNFLLPRKLALPANDSNKKWIERERKIAETRDHEERGAAEAIGTRLAALDLTITRKVGEGGPLYGSVTNADVADALNRIDFKVTKAQVRMPNGPLKTVGEHTVTVAPHTDVVVEVKVVVLGEST
jgi:large subunit ribosomal protein L9